MIAGKYFDLDGDGSLPIISQLYKGVIPETIQYWYLNMR